MSRRGRSSLPKAGFAAASAMAFVSAFAMGCEPVGGDQVLLQDSFVANSDAIFNGSDASDANFEGVVSLMLDAGAGNYYSYCSGTLIGPELVLTAAHCGLGGRVYVGRAPDEPVPLADTAAEQIEIEIHEDYVGTGTITDDIAVVRISPAITTVTPILPLPPNLGLNINDVGEDLTFVGYGLRNEHYDEDDMSIAVNRQKIDLPLLDLCDGTQCTSEFIDESEFEYEHWLPGENMGAGPCQGDSGGPALIERGGTTYVAGVASTINNAFCPNATRGQHVVVDDYYDFILDFARRKGAVLPICEQGNVNCDGSDPCVYDPAEELGYKCGGCPAGYNEITGIDGPECRDIDECDLGTDTCSDAATCINVPGYFDCLEPISEPEPTLESADDKSNIADLEEDEGDSGQGCAQHSGSYAPLWLLGAWFCIAHRRRRSAMLRA